MPSILSIGRVTLSASRRLTVNLRTELGPGPPVLDLRLQIAAGAAWCTTKQRITLEADAVPELLAVLERAMERLPEV